MAGGERREEKIQRREKVGIEDITRSRRLKYDKPNPGGSNDLVTWKGPGKDLVRSKMSFFLTDLCNYTPGTLTKFGMVTQVVKKYVYKGSATPPSHTWAMAPASPKFLDLPTCAYAV